LVRISDALPAASATLSTAASVAGGGDGTGGAEGSRRTRARRAAGAAAPAAGLDVRPNAKIATAAATVTTATPPSARPARDRLHAGGGIGPPVDCAAAVCSVVAFPLTGAVGARRDGGAVPSAAIIDALRPPGSPLSGARSAASAATVG